MSSWWRAAARAGHRWSPSPHKRLFHTIEAVPRETSGPKVASRERAQGRIPAVVFSQTLTQTYPDDPTTFSASATNKMLLTTETQQITSILSSLDVPFFCSTTFPIQIRAGWGSTTMLRTGKVLPIKVHRDEESGKIFNLVFVWAEDGTVVKVDVPIVFKGEDICPGIKNGGVLKKIRPCLKLLGPAESIPSKIEVDLSNLDIGGNVYLHDVTVDSALKLLSKNDKVPICKIRPTETDNQEVAK